MKLDANSAVKEAKCEIFPGRVRGLGIEGFSSALDKLHSREY